MISLSAERWVLKKLLLPPGSLQERWFLFHIISEDVWNLSYCLTEARRFHPCRWTGISAGKPALFALPDLGSSGQLHAVMPEDKTWGQLSPLRWAGCKFWGISQHVQKGDSSAFVISGMKEKAHEVDWLGDELLAFTPPQAGSSWPTARSRDANSSRQSQDGFFSSDLSVTCSLSKQSPTYVHDFILSCCLRHLPTYLFLQSQVTHIPVDHI